MTPIDEAAEVLDKRSMMDAGDYTTIAGFVLWQLGRIPEAHETFDWEGWRFTVLALKGHRIETVLATPFRRTAQRTCGEDAVPNGYSDNDEIEGGLEPVLRQ